MRGKKAPVPIPTLSPDEIERLAGGFLVSDGCWPWIRRSNKDGYGQFSLRGRPWRAHRVVYAWLIGPIPEGMTLDHLCRNRLCVNPAHLEPVTNRVNVLRGDTITGRNVRKTHCPKGHPLSPENLCSWERSRGKRSCRICRAERARERYWERKLASRVES